MRLVVWWSGAALLLSACGRTGATDAEQTPSTPRLEAWQLETEGAEPLVVGIFDTKEQTHCAFRPDTAGTTRCLPLPVSALELTTNFADSECRRSVYRAVQPAARAVDLAAGQSLTVPLPVEGCEQRYAVAQLAPLTDTTPLFFDTGSCRRSAAAANPVLADLGQAQDYVIDEVVAPERYVSGTAVDGPLLGERLRVRQIESGDGFRFTQQLFDETWQKPCSLSTQRDALGCMPSSLGDTTSFHVDAQCEGQQLWRSPSCSEPAFIGNYGDFYALGELWAEPVFERGKGCREWTVPGSSDEFYTRGDALGNDAIATPAWAQAGSGRLQLRGLQGDDGELVVLSDALFDATTTPTVRYSGSVPRYYDTSIASGCRPVWTTQGDVRCVPETAIVDPYVYFFSVDAECDQPALFCPRAEGCVGVDVISMAYDENGEYRAVSRNAGKAVAGDMVFGMQNGECRPQGPAGVQFFDVGEQLSWDDYPQLGEVNGLR
jgi:hypothetical protein